MIAADYVVLASGLWTRALAKILRRQRAAAGLRAFLYRHRAVPRPDPRSAGAARSRSLRLLQGGRRQAACSARSNPTPSRGRSTAFPGISSSASCRRISIISRRCWKPRCAACPHSRGSASASSSTARRASRPTSAMSSARRRNSAISSSPPASIRSASSRPAAPARRSPNGSSRAIRRWISGTSTSAACSPFNPTATISPAASPSRWACSTPCTGRSANTRPSAESGNRHSMPASPSAAPVSAKSRAGSAPTGSRPRAKRRLTNIATAARTGSPIRRAKRARCARASASST